MLSTERIRDDIFNRFSVKQRLVLVHSPNLTPHGIDPMKRVGRRTYEQVHNGRRILKVREIELGQIVVGQTIVPNVSDYPHNRKRQVSRLWNPEIPLLRELWPNLVTDWIRIGPEAARHRGADDSHSMSFVRVTVVERSARQQRDIHRSEVFPTDYGAPCIEHVILGRDAAFDGKADRRVLDPEGREIDRAGGLNAR
jgi:hypothetical protein